MSNCLRVSLESVGRRVRGLTKLFLAVGLTIWRAIVTALSDVFFFFVQFIPCSLCSDTKAEEVGDLQAARIF